MKHTRGRFVGNIISTIGGWPGSASGVWNRNDSATAVRGNVWPVFSTVPDSPSITGVARVSGSGTSIDITFTAPANNGGQSITSYTAVSTPGNVTASISQAGSGTIRVTGLTAGTSYTFVVYATNLVGNSANSIASSAIIAATVPGAPTIGTPIRVSGSSTSIDVPYSAPASNGGLAITSYTAVSSPGNITGTLSQAGSGTIRVTGLTAGTSYTFVVYATNLVGNSPNSATSSSLIPATVPGAPTIGTATASAPFTANVSFTAPASNGGLAITSYTAVSSPGGLTGTLNQAGSGTITVSGLSGGTNYTFVVYATNAVGNSANSAASNQITPTIARPPVDYLIVGGGGGGSGDDGGGGGAGGVRSGTGYQIVAGTYTITVGSGGAGRYNSNGADGGSSSFGPFTAAGGGGGAYRSPGNGNAGGSGGGGSGGAHLSPTTNKPGGAGNTPAVTPSQGNSGGTALGTTVGSAGGGGAGQAGFNNTGTASNGKGGNGISSSISGTATSYGGGGGGGATGGAGGTGGGGAGSAGWQGGNGANGTANTGGGGGGASNSTGFPGGTGGAGIVILRWLTSYGQPSSTTGSPTVVNSGGYWIYTWTGNGSITFS